MRFSSSFKVGVLALVSLVILVFTVMWVKGRALSSGERITVEFRDVNGIRAGSGVQMMGYRIGQVEEITPVIKGEKSFVRVKFVIIEPNIKIPNASEISIQQSGLIGEQFLEITPPRVRTIFIPVKKNDLALKAGDSVRMKLSGEYHDVGLVKEIEIVPTDTLSPMQRENIGSDYSYRVSYVIDMAGLVLPRNVDGTIVTVGGSTKLSIAPNSNLNIMLPVVGSKYTVIEPMRLADFMELQYRSAEALTETNQKISAILTDDVVNELKNTAKNLEDVTAKAKTTLDKAELLIETSKKELETTMASVNILTNKISVTTDNINKLVGDEKFRKDIQATTIQVEKLSKNLNILLEDPKTKDTLDNINVISRNLSDISSFVNTMSQDENLKNKLSATIENFNTALVQLNTTLCTINTATASDRTKVKEALQDAYETSENLRKFSEKLNKHFLLFRLMF